MLFAVVLGFPSFIAALFLCRMIYGVSVRTTLYESLKNLRGNLGFLSRYWKRHKYIDPKNWKRFDPQTYAVQFAKVHRYN